MLDGVVVIEGLELEMLDVGFLITFGGGALSKPELSLGGGEGGGVDDDDSDDSRGERSLVVAVFAVGVLLLTLLPEDTGSVLVAGGGGSDRPGPFDGKCGVPSASAEG